MIEVNKLDFSYTKNDSLLEDINFKIVPGTYNAIIGANGSGKTTLIKVILGILNSKNGNIQIDKNSLQSYTKKELAKKISFVPQNYNIDFNIKVIDLVKMGRYPHHKSHFFSNIDDYDKAIEALEYVDMKDFHNSNFNELSGGQKQRVMIARAIAQDTKIMICDEPISSLDINNQIKILKLFKKFSLEKKLTIIIILHELKYLFEFFDNFILLKSGKLIKTGNPKKDFDFKVANQGFGVNQEYFDKYIRSHIA